MSIIASNATTHTWRCQSCTGSVDMALGPGSLPSDKVLVEGEAAERRVRTFAVCRRTRVRGASRRWFRQRGRSRGSSSSSMRAVRLARLLQAGFDRGCSTVGAWAAGRGAGCRVPCRRPRTPPPFMAHELAAAIDLRGLQRHGEAFDDGSEESPRTSTRSVPKAVAACCKASARCMHRRATYSAWEKTRAAMNRPTGRTARTRRSRGTSLMVLPSREKAMGSMRAAGGTLDELSGSLGLVAMLPAQRPAVEPAAVPGLDPALADAGAGHGPGRDGVREDAPDGECAQAQALAFEHALDRRLAHERVLAAHVQDGLDVARPVRPASVSKLRYDRARIDSIFMVRASLRWFRVHRRLPDPAPSAGLPSSSLPPQLVMAGAVPNLSEPAQRWGCAAHRATPTNMPLCRDRMGSE